MRQNTVYHNGQVMIQHGRMYVSLERSQPAKVYYKYSDPIGRIHYVPLKKMYDAIDEYDNGYWGRLDKNGLIGGCGSLRFHYVCRAHRMVVQVYPINDEEYKTAWAQDVGMSEEDMEMYTYYRDKSREIIKDLDDKIWTKKDVNEPRLLFII